jgi:drug/metabolite transporter (DMT)-like permease
VIAMLAAAFALYQLIVKRSYATRRIALGVAGGVVVSMIALLLASPNVDLPNELWRSLPYLVALGVLGSALTRSRMPSKLTLPYARGEG